MVRKSNRAMSAITTSGVTIGKRGAITGGPNIGEIVSGIVGVEFVAHSITQFKTVCVSRTADTEM